MTETDDKVRNVANYVNPDVFPIPNTKEKEHNRQKNNGTRNVFIYDGLIDLTEIMRNYVVRDIEVNSTNIPKTMTSILRIEELRY